MLQTIHNTASTRLIPLLTGRKAYEFIDAACGYLRTHPGDNYIRLMVAREYLKLGLVTPAREVLLSVDIAEEGAAELIEVADKLTNLSGGQLSWDICAKQFERNIRVMADRPAANGILQAWKNNCGDAQLFVDKDGARHLRKFIHDSWRWLPHFGNHAELESRRALPPDVEQQMPGPYLFDGLALGVYFERIYRKTKHSFLNYSCALFIVEKHPACLAAILHLREWSDILSDPRIHWCIGNDCEQQLQQLLCTNADLPCPAHIIHLGETGHDRNSDAVKLVTQELERRADAMGSGLHRLNDRYAGRNVHYWSDRFAAALGKSAAPLRIVAAVSRHTTFLQHSMRDIKQAFESLGHQCKVLMEDSDFTAISPLRQQQAIAETDADLYFSIDHLRPEFCGMIPDNLPILTWDQDQLPHVITRENIQNIGAHDFVVGCSKPRCLSLGGNPAQFLYANVPTSADQFAGPELTASELQQYECAVSYVSHASQTPAQFHDQERRQLCDPLARRLLDCMYELLPTWLMRRGVVDGLVTTSLIRQCCTICGIGQLNPELKERLTSWYLWRLGDRIFRHQALEWVAQWARTTGKSLRIYGNGWEKHPTLAEFAAGSASNGRELLCIYRASMINLQLMPAGFIHQRALDGLAAGGFFLTRPAPADLLGHAQSELLLKVSELKITSSKDVLGCTDPELKLALLTYFRLTDINELILDEDIYDYITINAEVPRPDQYFADFGRITFNSAQEFATLADTFLVQADQRRDIAARMRRVVIDRFTYRAELQRFLTSMSQYLQQVAASQEINRQPFPLSGFDIRFTLVDDAPHVDC